MDRYQVVFATEMPVTSQFHRGLREHSSKGNDIAEHISHQTSTEYFPATSFEHAYQQASAFAEIGSTRIVMIREVGA